MNSVDTVKQIHRDVDRLLKGLNPKDQETVLKEAHNIVESLKKTEQISSKVKACMHPSSSRRFIIDLSYL